MSRLRSSNVGQGSLPAWAHVAAAAWPRAAAAAVARAGLGEAAPRKPRHRRGASERDPSQPRTPEVSRTDVTRLIRAQGWSSERRAGSGRGCLLSFDFSTPIVGSGPRHLVAPPWRNWRLARRSLPSLSASFPSNFFSKSPVASNPAILLKRGRSQLHNSSTLSTPNSGEHFTGRMPVSEYHFFRAIAGKVRLRAVARPSRIRSACPMRS